MLRPAMAPAALEGGPSDARLGRIVRLLADGANVKEIAFRLDLSVKTVESHRAKIMEKLDIHDTAGLVHYAIREGMIQP